MQTTQLPDYRQYDVLENMFTFWIEEVHDISIILEEIDFLDAWNCVHPKAFESTL